MLLGAGAEPVVLAHSLNDRTFAFQSIVWHRVMTRPRGPSPLKGQLELAVEVVPLIVLFQRETTYGVGTSPTFVRWSMKKFGVVAPFAELAGGVLRTDRPVPENISRFNWTAQAGIGFELAVAGHRSLAFGNVCITFPTAGLARAPRV